MGNKAKLYKILSIFLCISILLSVVLYDLLYKTEDSYDYLNLPDPTELLKPGIEANPVVLRGISVDPANPLKIKFILDEGSRLRDRAEVDVEAKRLVAYFLSALTIPAEDLWVNLSPYEKDRIIPNSLVETDMGRDLLAQDYILKQISSSLTHPNSKLGERYWKAHKGNQTLALNKIWILPENAKIYADKTKAIISEANLTVKTAKDFNALKQEKESLATITKYEVNKNLLEALALEVNQSQHFSRLRQIYHSLLLASWFKQRVQNSFYDQLYIDKSKTTGIKIDDPKVKQEIFRRYIDSFNKGVYKFVARDNSKLRRSYFSGGMVMNVAQANVDIEPLVNYESKMTFCSAVDADLLPVLNSKSNQLIERSMLSIFDERQKKLKEALDTLSLNKKTEVNLLVHSQGNYGVMGKSVLLANSLIAKSDQIKVNIFVRMDINGKLPRVYTPSENSKINIKHYFDHNAVDLPESDDIDVVFAAEEDTRIDSYSNAYKVLPYSYTLGNSNKQEKDITELSNPYSTLIVDEGLAELRTRRNRWTKDQLQNARNEWLEKQGLNIVANILKKTSENSIWSYAYVQKKESMEAFLSKLTESYRKGDGKYLNAKNPLVLHTVLGRHYSARDLKSFARQSGISFITDEGYQIPGELPITIVLHKQLKNQSVRELTSQLCGTSIKKEKTGDFLDFPLLVTGNASWQEALSIGAIWLHDNNDTLLSKKEQFAVLGQKMEQLAKETDKEFSPFLYNADNFLMETIGYEMFDNLELWGEYASTYCEFTKKMNMADEILIKLAENNKDTQLDKIVNESQLAYSSSDGTIVYKDGDRYRYNPESQDLELDLEIDFSDTLMELIQLYYPKLSDSQELNTLKQSNKNDMGQIINELANKAFMSFPFVKTIVQQRIELLESSMEILKDAEPTVNIYIQQQGGNGVMGMASILADSILSRLPKAFVKLLVIANSGEDQSNLFETDNKHKEISVITEGTKDFNARVEEGDLHLVVSGNSVDRSFLPASIEAIDVPGYAIAASYFSGRNKSRSNIISNNIADPLGTLILNESLMDRRQAHDDMSLEQLWSARIDWLLRYLSKQQYESLQIISKGSYEAHKGIWSFAYFQESAEFLVELMAIKRHINNFNYIENGKQLLINMVLGKKIDSPDEFARSLANSGVKVIDSNGRIIVNEIVNPLPITIVIHESLPNQAVISNMIDLGGTCVRTADGAAWIDYPVYITGQASWLEAISAAKLYVHDGNDTGPGVKIKQQEYLARKIMALKSGDDVKSWNTVRVEVNKIFNSTYMHALGVNNFKYKNLEEWTATVREHSKLLYKFNMADDIAINYAESIAKNKEQEIGGIALDVLGEQFFGAEADFIEYRPVNIEDREKFAGFSFNLSTATSIENPSQPFDY